MAPLEDDDLEVTSAVPADIKGVSAAAANLNPSISGPKDPIDDAAQDLRPRWTDVEAIGYFVA
jgi:hypothetical protein